MLGKLGSGWKGLAGGALLILSGVWELFIYATDGQGDPQAGLAKIASGLSVIGIRDAMGKG